MENEEELPQTHATLNAAITRIESGVETLKGAIDHLAEHVEEIVVNITRIRPLEAAKEVPQAAEAVIVDSADAAKAGVGAAEKVIETPVSVAQDATKDTQRIVRRGLRRNHW